MLQSSIFLSLIALLPTAYSQISIGTDSRYLIFFDPNRVLVNNSAILAGRENSTVTPVLLPGNANVTRDVNVNYHMITDTVAKIEIKSSAASSFLGARFSNIGTIHANVSEYFYGVWEYPWHGEIANQNISFDLKGIGNNKGINWNSARAPFFISSSGYGVYTDTLKMGSYDFTAPGQVQFIFNSSSLVYYIILPKKDGDLKSIIEQYTELSARAEIPPTSGFGPTFWSDDAERDFAPGVTNAQENFGDVVDHLYYNKIRANAMFADRPYGTGNRSFGNFDFDPHFYPSPRQFIANLTTWGYDFQVWIANRAFLYTELFNTSSANNWLFPGIDPVQFLGPALNLSIPDAYAYFKKRLSVFPELGVKGYKIDRGEEEEMPVYEQNIQMTHFLQLAYETMEEVFGKSKFFNFARSAVDRSRARTAIWNGDSHANFTGLAYSVASGIRAGLIAFPIWGSDTGGYVRDGSDTAGEGIAPQPEVWARWMWFSAFSPVYEIMIGTGHTPWYHPYNLTTETMSVLKKTTELHHDLLPYIKSYSYVASQTGIPIMRALFLEASQDKQKIVWESGDEYFFGSEFLVAPVVQNGGTRKVYFPKTGKAKNEKYLEYFGKKAVFQAPGTVTVSVTTNSMPVYVVQGAIVPRGDVYQGNNKWTEGWKPNLTVEVYPSFEVKESVFRYWKGEGDEGSEVKIKLETEKDGGRITVTYGDLGVDGKVVLYLYGGTQEAELKKGGGSFVVEHAQCVF